MAITSAMCDGTGLMDFRQKFPDRFYDVGIAESAAVDFAAGMAKSGLRPVVCIYSTFLQRSFDQIFQEVALQNLPVVFCVDRAGLVGSDGPTHHGLMDIGYTRMLPNMVLVAPADAAEMRRALAFALTHDHPVVIRYPKEYVTAKEFARAALDTPFELGKSVFVTQARSPPSESSVMGRFLRRPSKRARSWREEGIEAEVVNARFAAPVDESIVAGLPKNTGLITVEDHLVACGFGSAVLELAAAKGLDKTNIRVLGAPRRLIGHDSREAQLMEVGVTADEIVQTARQMLPRVSKRRVPRLETSA